MFGQFGTGELTATDSTTSQCKCNQFFNRDIFILGQQGFDRGHNQVGLNTDEDNGGPLDSL
jgi:hypothetical protein